MRWNARVQKLDLGLLKKTLNKQTNKKKKLSLDEDQTHDAASSRTASPTHYQLSYSGPKSTTTITAGLKQ